jgi:hypothetical protein
LKKYFFFVARASKLSLNFIVKEDSFQKRHNKGMFGVSWDVFPQIKECSQSLSTEATFIFVLKRIVFICILEIYLI